MKLTFFQANHDLYRKIWFRPRILRNVAKVTTKATMLGLPVSLPIWIAPMGVGKTAGPEGKQHGHPCRYRCAFKTLIPVQGELALSRGAAKSGITYLVSPP